jgi:type II secretory pathway component GspD/PulD (secretin)
MNMSNIDCYNLDNDAISGSNFFKNAKAGGPTSPGAAGGLSAQITVLDNPQYQAFIKALTMRENTSTLLAPRLTVYNTQRAHMFLAQQSSYVADYDISGDSWDPVRNHRPTRRG